MTLWDPFNGNNPVELSPGATARTNTFTDRGYYARMLSCLQAIVQFFRPASTPVTDSQTVQDEVKNLRNSSTPATVRIYNHGPDPVTILYGDLTPVHDSVGSSTLAKDDVDESPRPVIGKVQAICGAGKQAVVTVTEFPA